MYHSPLVIWYVCVCVCACMCVCVYYTFVIMRVSRTVIHVRNMCMCSYPYTVFKEEQVTVAESTFVGSYRYWSWHMLYKGTSARDRIRYGIMHHMTLYIMHHMISYIMHHMISYIIHHISCITWCCYCFHIQRDTGVLTHQTFVKLKKAEVTKNLVRYKIN